LSWLNILGIAVGLSMDAFAVSIAAGLSIPRLTARHVFRLAWHFGLFQFMMPVAGWLAGKTLAEHIAAFDHWIAFALLGLVGGRMLHKAAGGGQKRREGAPDPTRGVTLVALSIATSIDALAIGLSLAFLDVGIWLPAVVIGLVAGVLTVIGISLGSRIGGRFQRLAEAVGGIVLLGIGARLLVLHLLQ